MDEIVLHLSPAEAQVVLIGLVGVIHDPEGPDRWRVTASVLATRLEELRQVK
jgi:hypothetical protein